jgi:hypothetical protein
MYLFYLLLLLLNKNTGIIMNRGNNTTAPMQGFSDDNETTGITASDGERMLLLS